VDALGAAWRCGVTTKSISAARRRGLAALGGVLVLGCLQFEAVMYDDPHFPTPIRIGQEAWDLWLSGAGVWIEDILPSVARLVAGVMLAIVIAVPAGIALGRSPTATSYISPTLCIVRSIPVSMLMPVFLTVFGFSWMMPLAVMVFAATWPILLATIDGARALDEVQIDNVRAFRVRRFLWITMIVIPAAAPQIFVGLRQGISIAGILMVIAERVSNDGIGGQLFRAQASADMPAMWAWLALLGGVNGSLYVVLRAVERRLLAWHAGYTGQAVL
jgi:ABC-type nitrate/sulfonate/bicarbonate transport system permease component